MPTPQLLPEGKEGRRRLLYWYVEDAVKRRYGMFVAALEECTRDNLEFLKEKAVKVRGGVGREGRGTLDQHIYGTSITTSRLPSPLCSSVARRCTEQRSLLPEVLFFPSS